MIYDDDEEEEIISEQTEKIVFEDHHIHISDKNIEAIQKLHQENMCKGHNHATVITNDIKINMNYFNT